MKRPAMEAPKTLRASSRAKAATQMQRSRFGWGHLGSFRRGRASQEGKRGEGLWEIREESCFELAVRTDLALALENKGKGHQRRKDAEPQGIRAEARL